MNTKNNLVLFGIFTLLFVIIMFAGNQYKNYITKRYTLQQYETVANTLNNEVSTLIKEKKNATLAIAISFSRIKKLKDLLLTHNKDANILKLYASQLDESTNFENVWIHLVDKNSISIYRTWSNKHGDNVALFREDVKSMSKKPEIKSTISVGIFDMSFKAMVPIYDDELKYIGFVEVITHFNSIADKIKSKNFNPIILVDKKYKDQIKYPFIKMFSNDNYIANMNADKELVDYISKKGLKSFISPYENYILDNDKYLVVNYTLHDTSNKPMANLLMFKSLKNIDMTSLKFIQNTIELFTLLSLILLCIFFYFILNKEKSKIDINNKHTLLLFAFLFVFISFIYYLLFHWNYVNQKENFFQEYNQNIAKQYKIIYSKYAMLAQTMFNSVVNKPKVIALMDSAYDSPNQKKISRKMLYDLLFNDYKYFQSYELRQFHFHLKNNESFLRFHRPKKFGDSLVGIRSTVEWVSSNKRSINGFEEGRIFSGFRYVFPLFIETDNRHKKYVGSVETSFSAYAIAEEFTKLHGGKANFIIKENIVNAKVFNDEQSNYTKSEFNGYLYDKSIMNQLEQSSSQLNIKLLDNDTIQKVINKIAEGEIFSINTNQKNIIFTFLPIKNPLSHKVVAAIIIQKENYQLAQQYNLYLIFLLTGIIFILFVILYIYKEFSSKEKFRLLSLKTQKILDAQNSIVVVTDGKNIKDGNKMFLDYFGYETLEKFKKEHGCICDFFEHDDRFFHLGKIENNDQWVTEIDKLPYKEHIVAMKDSTGKQSIFFVSINNFDNGEILSFGNISDTMTDHFSLMEKVIHDKLTNAYNRDYFDTNTNIWINKLNYRQNLNLGVVIFDIDFFKKVNDTYGHNCGDSVLKHLVSLVQASIRAEDTLIRWGGEEFLLISYVNNIDNLHYITENIRKKIQNDTFDKVGKITCSFGGTIYKKGEPISSTIERADQALYEAKNSGRNRVILKGIS